MASLYLKHRPRYFSEVYGNTVTIKTIKSMIGDDNRPHAILLHGPTGCGKTTIARIIAEELNCVGEDFHEMDSAHFRGIDTIRGVRENAMYQPMYGKVSVWLLDECHKLTGDAQTALLKILEDTPSHVYFILATTDPQKMLKTIRGRCSEFKLAPLNLKDMRALLEKIVTLEKEVLEDEVYDRIIDDSNGLPRNALQILDQVLLVSPKERLEIAHKSVEEEAQSIDLCRALINGEKWKKVANILVGLKSHDAESVRRHVLGYASSVLLNKTNDRAATVLSLFADNFWDSGFPGLVEACYAVDEK